MGRQWRVVEFVAHSASGFDTVIAMADSPITPPPGWFPDPWGFAAMRYWDGQRWTQSTHGAPPHPAPGYPSAALANAGGRDTPAAPESSPARNGRGAKVTFIIGLIFIVIGAFYTIAFYEAIAMLMLIVGLFMAGISGIVLLIRRRS